MLGSFVFPYLHYEQFNVLPCKPFPFNRWGVYYPSPPECKEAVHRCPRAGGIRTGQKNTSRSSEVFLRHLLRRHPIPEKCAKRVKILSDMIVKMDAYPVAYGGFSDVWSCQLRYTQKPPKRVAVKAIRPAIASKEELQVKRKAVAQELNVWVGLNHQNVLPLYGITDGFGPFPAFVCPWADNGTLSEYLEKCETLLDLKTRMTLLCDIAAGLRYLHSCDIVHGDLSGSNILITNKGQACLSDFGLSTLVEQVSDTTVSGISFPGNIRWTAPELLDGSGEGGQLSSPQADVYSFGSIMLQILSGKLPFHGIQREAQIVVMISRGHRPLREPRWDGKAIPEELWSFLEACWAPSPRERPSSKKIVTFIRRQLSRL